MSRHLPVLLDEVLKILDPQPDDIIVDATFGFGGYTRALLDRGAVVHAFDRDPDAINIGRGWSEARTTPPRLTLHPRRFSEMVEALGDLGITRVQGIAMDIGVSSMQLDAPARGFAFSASGPLDMRMSQEGESAADFLNGATEEQIADVLYNYGEERRSRRIARAIVAARPLRTTQDLARIVRDVVGYNSGLKTDPATRSFQAVRIHINGELDELSGGLIAAEHLLEEGGKLAVVSFHSLEDRVVKRFFRDASTPASTSRHLPQRREEPMVFAEVSKAIRPSSKEVARNPRARSSTLRHARRTAAPARAQAA